MKIFLLFFFLLISCPGFSQVTDIDTIQYKGTSDKYINLVILGDGFTEAEQDSLLLYAQKTSSYFFSQTPLKEYAGFFNVFALKVVSNESGAKHPSNTSECATSGLPISNPDNYFGSTFDYAGLHRLVYPTNMTHLSEALSFVPMYDQVILLVNSKHYGGAGGQFAVTTCNPSSNEIMLHEIGHSFAGLADEYWVPPGYERRNMTQNNNENTIKWKHWLSSGDGIGIYPHAENTSWFRPHNDCKMRSLERKFCNVCREGFVEKIHTVTNPIVSFAPDDTTLQSEGRPILFAITELMKPQPNTNKASWYLNDSLYAVSVEYLTVEDSIMKNGINKIQYIVTDTSTYVKDPIHLLSHSNIISWTVNKTLSGILINNKTNKLKLDVYPIPATDLIHLSAFLEKATPLTVELISSQGVLIKEINPNADLNNNKVQSSIDLSQLPPGNYLLKVKTADFFQTVRFTKI